MAEAFSSLYEGIADADGESACERLTPAGQVALAASLRALREGADDADDFADPEDSSSGEAARAACVEEVEEGAPTVDLAERTVASVSEDEVEIEGDSASVSCEFRGEMRAERVDGDWLIPIFGCTD